MKVSVRPPLKRLPTMLLVVTLAGCQSAAEPGGTLTVAETPTRAITDEGHYVSWTEHLIDSDELNNNEGIRGGDGLKIADVDRDGWPDVISVHEDSHYLRIAFGTASPDEWVNVTIAKGRVVGAIEDVAVGDVNGDGWPDLVVACEEAHLAYFQNPAQKVREAEWASLVPSVTTGRGSWLQVTIEDLNGDGRNEVVAANKGFADVVRLKPGEVVQKTTSMFTLTGDPLTDDSWQEQPLHTDGIPNQALAVDIDQDGDTDILAASRLKRQVHWLLNDGVDEAGQVRVTAVEVQIAPAFDTEDGWRAVSNAFNADFADMNGDGRTDLILAVAEFYRADSKRWDDQPLVWLEQPADLRSEPWRMHRIGSLVPDWVTGFTVADIDGDGDLDAIAGGYSGLNLLRGGYSGASRDEDDPDVTAADTLGRMAWFENREKAEGQWIRHDISRRVRGMYDEFIARDMDGDGDTDFVATRGNSGIYDGVFWLEQVRTLSPQPAFRAARSSDSRQMPLAPEDWQDQYGKGASDIAPNKAAQQEALKH
ncbi:MAG: VCBS repeat-containing protein [Pseudomonadales bacterium]|nr:VCBS repeat-containing protein [Pseudomonadales bacterium]